jgi:AsmA protein
MALSIICLLIVIGIFAAACLVYFVDPNKLRPVLIEEVKKETGYLLTIDDKLSWSFYPRLAIKAHHLSLKQPGEASAFLDASDVHLATDLMEVLRSREKLQGKVTVSTLSLMNIKSENVSADISVENKVLTLSAVTATLYGGKLHGNASGQNFATLPKWQWNLQLDKIQLKPLLQDAHGENSKIRLAGTGSFSMTAETSGKNREQLLQGLNGSSVFQLEDGIVEGIDINYFLQLASALVNKQPTEQLMNTNQTTFNQLNGTASIKNGAATTNDLLLMAPAFSVQGKGSVELFSQRMNLELKINPQMQKQKWNIPVLVTGDLNHPDIHLDMLEVQKMLAAMEIDRLKEKASVQIQKHIKGKAGELLQNLLGK